MWSIFGIGISLDESLQEVGSRREGHFAAACQGGDIVVECSLRHVVVVGHAGGFLEGDGGLRGVVLLQIALTQVEICTLPDGILAMGQRRKAFDGLGVATIAIVDGGHSIDGILFGGGFTLDLGEVTLDKSFSHVGHSLLEITQADYALDLGHQLFDGMLAEQ